MKAAQPQERIDLLIRANLLENRDAAARAWRRWIELGEFDDVGWPEVRLLACLSARIGEIDPDSSYRPRIQGIARRHWTETQLTIAGAVTAIRALTAAGIPVLVIKGAAQYAEALTDGVRRIFGDVDVLVPPERMQEAVDLLLEKGWRGAKGETVAYLRKVARVRTGMNLRSGAHAEIDVHQRPFHAYRADPEADRRLWTDAVPAQLADLDIRVPASEASTIIALVHGTTGPSGDWAMDVSHRLAASPFDWPRFAELVDQWRLANQVLPGLVYLRDVLHQPVPDGIVDNLTSQRGSLTERVFGWAGVRNSGTPNVLKQALRSATGRRLRRQGFAMASSDRTCLPVIRPSFAGAGAAPAGDTVVRRDVAGTGTRLRLEYSVVEPAEARRVAHDVYVDGELTARLRSRFGRKTGTRRLTARIPLPSGTGTPIQVEIRAVPIRYVPADRRPGIGDGAQPFLVRRLDRI